jgi:sugar lactone lactonase YvrE
VGAPETILDGLWFGEGPRWHHGALWFSDIWGHRVVRAGLDGTATTEATVEHDEPSGIGWLPDGRLLVVAMETQRLLRVEPDGEVVEHADLSPLARGSANDMIVAADGTAYVGDMGMRIQEGGGGQGGRHPGQTIRVTPDGAAATAADDLAAPNGHALTEDGRTLVVAESGGARLTAFEVHADGTLGPRRVYAALDAAPGARVAAPDGICLDAEGAAWVADPVGARVVRVVPGGVTTQSFAYDGAIPVACVLGGDDRRTLLICAAADWRREGILRAPSGRIDAVRVDVPGSGRP